MQALILAAGMGKRLSKYTKDNTKCMVEVCEKKLIDRAIDALRKNGIKKLIMVVGYKKENLKEYLLNNNHDMEIVFVDNDQYDVSNNIYSLYLAKEFLEEEDTLLLESDLIFEDKLITSILKNPNSDIAAVAKYQKWMDGTVITIDENNTIKEFIEKKDISENKLDEYYKTINIYKLSKEFSKDVYLPFLETFMKVYGKNEYYELAFKIIANLSRSDFKAEIIEDINWYEIDNENDLVEATKIFKNS